MDIKNPENLRKCQPRVAVILPVFNVERYLPECLDSLLAQTYANFEIIAVNDGSSDGSGALLDSYATRYPRIHVITQQNGGLAAARNKALSKVEENCSFDYVSFVDSDDRVEPTFIAELVAAAEKNNSDISCCGYYKFDESRRWTEGAVRKACCFGPEEYVELVFSVRGWRQVNGGGGMVWKCLFREKTVSGLRFPEDRKVLEDEPYCVLAAGRSYRISFIPERLYGYRMRANSLIRQESFELAKLNARRLCLDSAQKAPSRIRNAIAGEFAGSFLTFARRTGKYPVFDLTPYVFAVNQAVKAGYLSPSRFLKFRLFCSCATIMRLYHQFSVRRVKLSQKMHQ
ncbi:MAG: glycosyltransferase [Sutterellaceae bacterium]|nr:glycosyltransferase [Sutterellaceae bacterium]MDY2869002.1 glycosyltransferase [Mesosutterella sp.]